MNGTPIIDPMFFYWASFADSIGATLFGLSFLGMAFSVFLFIAKFIDDKDIKPTVIGFSISIFMLVLICFIPTSDTLYKMAIAKFATVENAEVAKNAGRELIEFLNGEIIKTIEATKE
jgi:hypothetical protein